MTEHARAVQVAAKDVHHTGQRLEAGIKSGEVNLACLGELRVEFSEAIKQLREAVARLEAVETAPVSEYDLSALPARARSMSRIEEFAGIKVQE